MKRQSTSMPFCLITSCTQRDVIHAQGHTGSQKKSRSASAIDDQPDTVVVLRRDLARTVDVADTEREVVHASGSVADPRPQRRRWRRGLDESDAAGTGPPELDPAT